MAYFYKATEGTCLMCKTPYRIEDLIQVGYRYLCRWHWKYGLRR